jgi:hypothetical protein
MSYLQKYVRWLVSYYSVLHWNWRLTHSSIADNCVLEGSEGGKEEAKKHTYI